MFKLIFTILFAIFAVAIIGSVILEQFPQLVPVWEEFKMHIVSLYDLSVVKYGTGVTFMIIVAIIVLIGSSKKI